MKKTKKVKMYELSMKFDIDVKDQTLDNAMSLFKMPTPCIENYLTFRLQTKLPTIPTEEQIEEMEEIFIGQELSDNGLVICGARFSGYESVYEVEVEIEE